MGCLAQLGQVTLELGLWQGLAKEPVVGPVKSYGMIPRAGGDVDGAIQKAVTLILVEFEPEGLTHGEKV